MLSNLRRLGLRVEVDAAALMKAVDSLEKCSPTESNAADRSVALLEELSSWADKSGAQMISALLVPLLFDLSPHSYVPWIVCQQGSNTRRRNTVY